MGIIVEKIAAAASIRRTTSPALYAEEKAVASSVWADAIRMGNMEIKKRRLTWTNQQ